MPRKLAVNVMNDWEQDNGGDAHRPVLANLIPVARPQYHDRTFAPFGVI